MLHQRRERFLLVSRKNQPHDGHAFSRAMRGEVSSATAASTRRARSVAAPAASMSTTRSTVRSAPRDARSRVRGAGASPGLVYVDAHADFATRQESATGSPASMCLALAVGRGDSPLAELGGDAPLVRPEHVVVVGRRDEDEPWYGQEALDAGPVLDLSHEWMRARGAAATASAALDRVARPDVGGFWIHVDADVLDPSVLPAVDSPEPGGLELDELAAVLAPLVRHPRALGMELTIYDPHLDPDRTSAARLATLVERVLDGGRVGPARRIS